VLPHLDAAYTFARYLTRNAHDAEDVVQDARLRAIRHYESYSGQEETSARAWLLAIVRNTAYSARRRHRAEDAATEFDEAHRTSAG
jgi:RNA polymerase sigma-70 factor, ECF subfamily